ncbi:glycosyltransferase [Pedobacter zeae]|uniref:Glycosyl transferase n=1 Tax=Pedobacter zeae TaxID=1737356 RepID=A0A7W6P8E0_9SPHI|nr:glycosyltransferase [Pedobacter zeae]MBB4109854.1 glycosyltransferase involved in cell wall biosynthesis [Pedobacter zeae]GGH14585.1 glycosyl transferase [Pedobacter zeae]
MKVAIIQEWLTTMGGSEKVVQAIADIYPQADIFTLVADNKLVMELGFEHKKITTSIIQKLPFGLKKYKTYLPLFPFAIEQFDLSEYDLIISSNHAVSKGVLTTNEQLHITYCHSPIRYAWDLHHQYLKEEGLGFGIKGLLARYFLHRIRIWDFISSVRPDYYVSNSNFIANRINKVYQKNATTIYPPIEIDDFVLETSKDDYYITSSRMVPYKKIDLIVEAFTKMPDRKLVVVGDGPDYKKIKSKAGSNITFVGYLSFKELIKKLQKARAFVFAAIEDFGMLPVEAQACGTPVIALGKGGSLETVKHGITGILYPEQTIESLIAGVKEFETYSFDPLTVRTHAETFGIKEFKKKFSTFVEEKLTEKNIQK